MSPGRQPPFPSTPPAGEQSPFFRFDLTTVFRSAVELGRALAVCDAVGTASTPVAKEVVMHEFTAVLEASRAADVASDRLLCVLNPRQSSVPDWSRQLDLADALPDARQALRTLGLALADVRGDGDWATRGRELLSAGTRHLWSGMGPADRAVVRELLVETHQLWQWPAEAGRETGEYTGPRATLSDPRVIDQNRWRTMRADYLDHLQRTTRDQYVLADTIRLPDGDFFDIYRLDVKGTRYSVPSICPNAAPKPPVELRPDGDLLAEMECRFRSLGLVKPDESMRWVGRQDRRETRCGCELAPAEFYRPRPPEWRSLRDLKFAIVAMMKLVGPYVEGRRTGQILSDEDR